MFDHSLRVQGIFCVPGHEQHLDPRTPRANDLGKLSAVHARHDHIGQQQLDGPLVASLARIASSPDAVTRTW